MDTLIAGMATGALMAQTFILIGCLTLFFMLKNPPPELEPLISRLPPGALVFGVLASAYPLWGIVGVILAFLFLALENGYPAAGLGSANLAYTLGVAVAAVALALPFMILLRRFWPGVAAMTIAVVAIFGWLLPILAT